MTYISGMIAPVPKANKKAYHKMATAMAELFKKRGALEVVECWGVDIPDGETTSMPMAVQLKEDETVVFAWIIWPDKATQDAAMSEDNTDLEAFMHEPPFEGKRMIFGGFEQMLKA